MDDLIPPQPNPKPDRRFLKWFATVGVIGAFVGLFGLFYDLSREDSIFRIDRPNYIVGLDHRWDAKEIVWRDFHGMWELNVVLSNHGPMTADASLLDMSAAEVARGLCGSVLSTLPRREDPPIERAGIFRLNVNFAVPSDMGLGEELLFTMPVPVNIESRACPPELGEYRFPLNYPAPLQRWQFNGFAVVPFEEISHWDVDAVPLFAWVGNGEAPFSDVQYLCSAAQFEAPIWRPEGPLTAGERLAFGLVVEAGTINLRYAEFDGENCRIVEPPEMQDA